MKLNLINGTNLAAYIIGLRRIGIMKPFKNIVLPTDFSPSAAAAFPQAVALAKQYNATVHLVHVIEHESLEAFTSGIVIGVRAWINARRKECEKKVVALAATMKAEHGIDVLPSCIPGHAVREIVKYAKEAAADVIVMGTRGQSGVSHFMFGSVAERVVRLSETPVLTVHPETTVKRVASFKSILLPTDFSTNSAAGVTYALELARAGAGKIILAHVVDDSVYHIDEASAVGVPVKEEWIGTLARDADKKLAVLASCLRAESGLEVEPVRVIGQPARKLVEIAEAFGVDLIVMGTHGYTGLSRAMFGSVAEKVVQTSLIPVLAVKPPAA